MLSDEEKREYEELKSLLYTGTISQYGKRKLIDIIEKQSKEIEHQIEKRANQRLELAILNAKQIEFNKLKNTVNSYKGQFKRQQKEIEELKQTLKYTQDSWYEDAKIIDKIKAKIEELEIEQESNREDLKIAIDNLLFQNIDKIADKISINMSVRGVLQSLLEKE